MNSIRSDWNGSRNSSSYDMAMLQCDATLHRHRTPSTFLGNKIDIFPGRAGCHRGRLIEREANRWRWDETLVREEEEEEEKEEGVGCPQRFSGDGRRAVASRASQFQLHHLTKQVSRN